ncbi:hypothetical protein SNE40_012483 [Patella caerulea]|uniref:Uncharacterized protein n=1 Tax=Patella caerulea TaxID=87958 RepID=A0AAN8PNB4_PATCE
MASLRLLFSIERLKCSHLLQKKLFKSYLASDTFQKIIDDLHSPTYQFICVLCSITDTDNSTWHEIECFNTSLGDVANTFHIKYIKIKCLDIVLPPPSDESRIIEADAQRQNAFDMLMRTTKSLPKKKEKPNLNG